MNKFFTLPYHYKWRALLVLIVLLLIIGSGLFKIQINMDIRNATAKQAVSEKEQHVDSTQTENKEISFVRITSKNGSILNKTFLTHIESLSNKLRQVPETSQVDDILTAKGVFNPTGTIITGNLIQTLPTSSKDINTIKKRFSQNKILMRDFISSDYKTTTIILQTEQMSIKKMAAWSKNIENVLNESKRYFAQIVYVGPAKLNHHYNLLVHTEVPMLVSIATVIMLCIVFLITRSYLATAITAIIMFTNLLLSFGAIGLLHLQINILSASLPIIIIILGSTEALHLLCAYIKSYSQDDGHPLKAVNTMINHVYKPSLMTAGTTIIGFFSFGLSSSPAISEFGLSGGVSMLVCAVNILFFTPMLLAFFPSISKKVRKKTTSMGQHFSLKLASWITKHSKQIIIVFILLLSFFIWLGSHITMDSSFFNVFRPTYRVSKEIKDLRNNFGGINILTLTIKGQEIDSAVTVANLKNMEKFVGKISLMSNVSNVYSFTDVIATLNQQMHNGNQAFYKIPNTNQKIQQLLTLINLDDYSGLINYDLDTLKIKIRLRMVSSNQVYILENKILAEFHSIPDNPLKVSTRAPYHKINNGMRTITYEGAYSLLTCFFIIFIVFCIQFRSILSGILCMAANFTPLIILAGIITILHINIDAPSIVATIIVLSVCVDDTIHFFTKFSMFSQSSSSVSHAITQTLDYELLPLTTTSLSISLAMLTTTFSNTTPIYEIGIIISIGIFIAMLCDVFLTPALLSQFRIITLLDILSFQYDTSILLNSPIFQGMTKNEIKKITLLGYTQTINKDQQLIKKGTQGNTMFLLLKGEVEVELENTPPVLLSIGAVIGEMAYFSNEKRTANCYAKQDSTLLVFDEKCMRHSMRLHKKLFYRLNKNIVSIIVKRLTKKAHL